MYKDLREKKIELIRRYQINDPEEKHVHKDTSYWEEERPKGVRVGWS